jgi:Calx-beta domain-containing protein/CARDB protein
MGRSSVRALQAFQGLACILVLLCGLVAPAEAAQLTLGWADNASDESGSRIERRLNPGGSYSEIATVGANVTSYTDTTVAAGQAYCYRVRAYNSAGSSGYSNEACATAAAAPPPADTTPPVRSNGAPTAVLSAGTTQVTLSLSTNENATCKWATSPNTSYSSMPHTFTTTGGLAHSALRTGLSNGSAYTSYVRCRDAANNANSNDYSIAFSVAQRTAASLLQFSLANYSVGETGSTATVTVTRTLSTALEAQVHYETSDGSARATVDYTPAEGDLVFKVGETTRTFKVPVIDNAIVDGSRMVLLRLSDPRNAELGAQNTAVLRIQDDDGGGTLRFSASGYSYPDTAGYANITVTRSGGKARVSVKFRTGAAGTAVPGTDYDPINPPGILEFLPNETTKTFTLRVKANSVVNSSKTVQLLLSDPVGGATLGTPASANLTITNDDTGGGIRFGASSYSVAENAGIAHVTVTRSGGAASGVTVEVKAVDGTAKATLDYGAPSPSVLAFAAGETSKTVDVPIIANALAVTDRSLRLKLQSPGGGGTLSSPSTATLNITKVGIRFSQTAYTVNEGPGSATITVSRAGSAGNVTVQVQTLNDSAVAPADYTAISPAQTLTFSSGQRSKTFTVAIPNNSAKSVNRSLRLRLLNAVGEPLGIPNVATLTILDKGLAELQLTAFAPPAVGFIGKTIAIPNTVRNVSALKAPASTLYFVLSKNTALESSDVILGTRSIGTLEGGAVSASSTTLTIPGSTAPGAYTLFAVVDGLDVVPEQNGGNNVVTASLTILPNVVRTFGVSGVLTNDGCASPVRNGRVAALGSLVLSGQTGTAVTGGLTLTFPLAPGLSVSGPLTATLDAAGHLGGTFTYSTRQGSTTISSGVGTLTGILNGGALEVDFTGQSASGETCDFAGWLTAPAVPIGFMVFQHDTLAGSLGATNGAFVATPSFPASPARYRVLFDVAGDSAPFPAPEAVLFTGPPGSQLAETGGAERSQLASNVVEYRSPWVTSPPTAPAGSWTETYEGNHYDYTETDPEAASRLVVPVLTLAANGSLTRVDWTYRAASGTRLSAAPAFMRSIRLQVLDPCGVTLHDSSILDPTTLSRALNPGVAITSVAELRFRYVDDLDNVHTVHYGAAAPGNCKVVEFSAPSYSAAENVATANITVRRAGDLTGTVTVNFTTSNGTAQQGQDYTNASQVVTLGPSVSSKVVGVPIINNGTPQAGRTVLLSLSGPGGGAALGPLSTAVLTINDDDPRVGFSSATYSAGESSSQATITVQRTGATAPVVSVPYSTSDGTALAGLDYTAASGVLTFASGQTSKTFTVPIVNDTLAEGGQTVNLALGTPTGALLTTLSAATLTIADNDSGGTVAFAAPTFSVVEDAGTVTITVVRTGGNGGITVQYATADGTGKAGTDYQSRSGTLTFAANESSKTFAIPVGNNTGSSANKSVLLTLSNPSGAALGTPSTATLWVVSK